MEYMKHLDHWMNLYVFPSKPSQLRRNIIHFNQHDLHYWLSHPFNDYLIIWITVRNCLQLLKTIWWVFEKFNWLRSAVHSFYWTAWNTQNDCTALCWPLRGTEPRFKLFFNLPGRFITILGSVSPFDPYLLPENVGPSLLRRLYLYKEWEKALFQLDFFLHKCYSKPKQHMECFIETQQYVNSAIIENNRDSN